MAQDLQLTDMSCGSTTCTCISYVQFQFLRLLPSHYCYPAAAAHPESASARPESASAKRVVHESLILRRELYDNWIMVTNMFFDFVECKTVVSLPLSIYRRRRRLVVTSLPHRYFSFFLPRLACLRPYHCPLQPQLCMALA
jgi:hypothetical protein